MEYLTERCEECYWFESNGLEGENAAYACRNPIWEWTDEETDKWHRESVGKEFAVRDEFPPFNKLKHCDFKKLVGGKSYVDIEYG